MFIFLHLQLCPCYIVTVSCLSSLISLFSYSHVRSSSLTPSPYFALSLSRSLLSGCIYICYFHRLSISFSSSLFVTFLLCVCIFFIYGLIRLLPNAINNAHNNEMLKCMLKNANHKRTQISINIQCRDAKSITKCTKTRFTTTNIATII